MLVLLTNYGMLIKIAIDISSLLLGSVDLSLKDNALLLCPNPVNNIVTFSDNSIKAITLYDINRQKVLSIINSNSFSVKALAQDVYIVKTRNTDNIIITKKLIVD